MLNSHLIHELKLTPTKADTSLYLAHDNNTLIGLNVSYVDDLLRTGTHPFENLLRNSTEFRDYR